MHHISRRQWKLSSAIFISAIIIYHSMLNTGKIFINFVLGRESSSECSFSTAAEQIDDFSTNPEDF